MSRDYFVFGQCKVEVTIGGEDTRSFLGLVETNDPVVIYTDFTKEMTTIKMGIVHIDMDVLSKLAKAKCQQVVVTLSGAVADRQWDFYSCELTSLKFSPGTERSVFQLVFESTTVNYL